MVFLADKVWQGGGQSSVDMNRLNKQYNSRCMTVGNEEKDKHLLTYKQQMSKLSESLYEDPDYANFLQDS